MYTQSLFILCHSPLSTDELGVRVRRMNVLGRHTPPPAEHWARNAPGWVTQYAGHPRGRVIIDSVSCPWPDQFEREKDPSLYSAWSMGLLGTGITPGALTRAAALAKESLQDAVASHGGFIRLRMSYVPEDGEPLIPEARCPFDELAYLTRAAYFILEDEQAFALFVPAAEILHADRQVWMAFDRAFGDPRKMLTLWTHRRHEDGGPGPGSIHILGCEALQIPPTRLRYDENAVPRKQAISVAARLTEQLAETPHLRYFEDAQERTWCGVPDDNSAAAITWSVS